MELTAALLVIILNHLIHKESLFYHPGVAFYLEKMKWGIRGSD